jgi:outer membrane receptor protein involved in Fe transport
LSVAITVAICAPAWAQETPAPATTDETPTLDVVEVTAQKRSENLQKVPISLTVLGEAKLEELNVTDFEDYVKYLPTVSYQTYGPGFALINMRGVSSASDGNHSGSLPSVGVYLDEQPITTIQGPLDIHIYDVARVEALAGPQGTLYGASAESGALRIITNKPNPDAFSSGYALEVNSVDHGGIGHIEEGFVNIPINPHAAVRLVGWHQHDAGYIDNVAGQRTYPVSGITVSNADDCVPGPLLECTYAEKDNYNDVDTTGARAALRVDINDNWTVTGTVMGQRAEANGGFAFDEVVGDLELAHYYPEGSRDRWWQAALTVEGKIGNFDLTYNYAHLNRRDEIDSDYSDYSFWYDTIAQYGSYICSDFDLENFTCANGTSPINPSQFIRGKDRYTKDSHELRIASPAENRFRFVGGLFWENQFHDIEQAYIINGLSPQQEVTGWPDALWLTKQERRDHDEAVFGELTFDFIPDKLTGTIGARHFRVHNTLEGFFGFGAWGWVPDYGEIICPPGAPTFNGAPCETFDKFVDESGTLGKANLTWNIRPDKMVYFTWSEGFRPGGLNRRGSLPPFLSDYLTNVEFGWKTQWMDNRVAFNGSVFRESWKDFQFAILGANGLTEIKNANQARINGVEMSLDWAATYNLSIGAAGAWYDAELTENFCGWIDEDGNSVTVCPPGTLNPNGTFDDPTDDFPVDGPEAPSGTQLPVTPKFKGNLNARYTWDVGEREWFVQGALVHVGERKSDLRLFEREVIGDLPAYTVFDLSFGVRKGNWALSFYANNLFDERATISRYTGCVEDKCGAPDVVPEYPNGQVYTVTNQPRTFGIKWSLEF